MKTCRAAAKRFKKTGTGKLKRNNMPICTTKCESCGDIVHHGWISGSWYEVGYTLQYDCSWLGAKKCEKCESRRMIITDLERTEKDGPPPKEPKPVE